MEPSLLVALVLVALVLVFALGAIVWSALHRAFDRSRRQGRARHAHRGESAARRLLERAGYTILEAQVRLEYTFRCDGELHRAGLRADFLVQRGARRYVAEVKTGALVTALTHAPTRRQLLEYQHAFQVAGVLLVDADTGRIRVIEFGPG